MFERRSYGQRGPGELCIRHASYHIELRSIMWIIVDRARKARGLANFEKKRSSTEYLYREKQLRLTRKM